jgi:hypothetical protein
MFAPPPGQAAGDVRPPGSRRGQAAAAFAGPHAIGYRQSESMLGMSHDATLLFNAVIAILALILMITRLRIHPFIALTITSGFLGLSGMPLPRSSSPSRTASAACWASSASCWAWVPCWAS